MRIIRSIVFLILDLVLIAGILYCCGIGYRPLVEGTDMYLIPNNSKPVFEVKDDTIIMTNLGGVSNIVNNLQVDGFKITRQIKTRDNIDIYLDGSAVDVRLYYDKDGKLMVFTSPYEKSKEVLAYINENFEKGGTLCSKSTQVEI